MHQWGGLKRGGGGFPTFLSLFGTFPIFFWDFPELLGDGPGIFPICPFPLSRPVKSTYEEQSRKGRTLVPVFVPGEHPPKPPFWKPPFWKPPKRVIGRYKGGFVKGWFWRKYPRSGFRSGGTSAETTLLETTLLRTPENMIGMVLSLFGPLPTGHVVVTCSLSLIFFLPSHPLPDILVSAEVHIDYILLERSLGKGMRRSKNQ